MRPSVAPWDEIFGAVGLWPSLCAAIDVRQQRSRDAVPLIGNKITERLELVKRLPFGELGRIYFGL